FLRAPTQSGWRRHAARRRSCRVCSVCVGCVCEAYGCRLAQSRSASRRTCGRLARTLRVARRTLLAQTGGDTRPHRYGNPRRQEVARLGEMVRRMMRRSDGLRTRWGGLRRGNARLLSASVLAVFALATVLGACAPSNQQQAKTAKARLDGALLTAH